VIPSVKILALGDAFGQVCSPQNRPPGIVLMGEPDANAPTRLLLDQRAQAPMIVLDSRTLAEVSSDPSATTIQRENPGFAPQPFLLSQMNRAVRRAFEASQQRGEPVKKSMEAALRAGRVRR
jgi:hypothetical protein